MQACEKTADARSCLCTIGATVRMALLAFRRILLRQIWLILRSLLEIPVFFRRLNKKTTTKKRAYELIESKKSLRLTESFSCIKYTDIDVKFPLSDSFILATDIVESTRLYNENPRRMKALVDEHDSIVRELQKVYKGHVVANEGDSFHLVFEFVKEAVGFAESFRMQLKERGVSLRVRVGINQGRMHVRKLCGYKCYGEPVEQVLEYMKHNTGDKICIRRGLVDKYHIEGRKQLCIH